jgi:hypothetical protein
MEPSDRSGYNNPTDVLHGLPPGQPVPPGMNSMDVITNALANLKPAQMLDVLAQMKVRETSAPKASVR